MNQEKVEQSAHTQVNTVVKEVDQVDGEPGCAEDDDHGDQHSVCSSSSCFLLYSLLC